MESITCNTILKNGSFSARVKKYTFNKNKFKFNKKYLDHVFSVLIQVKYFFCYMNSSFNAFLMRESGLPFVLPSQNVIFNR